MSDPIDTAIDGAESETASNKRGARDRHYFCAAIGGEKGNKKIIHEAIHASSPDEAKELFTEKYGIKPSVCDDGKGNGYYVAMGTGMSDAQRISVTVTPEQLARRTTAAFKGQFKGWNVWASGLAACTVEDEHYGDNDLVSVEFASLVDKEVKLPKPKLKKREVVRLVDIENAEQI